MKPSNFYIALLTIGLSAILMVAIAFNPALSHLNPLEPPPDDVSEVSEVDWEEMPGYVGTIQKSDLIQGIPVIPLPDVSIGGKPGLHSDYDYQQLEEMCIEMGTQSDIEHFYKIKEGVLSFAVTPTGELNVYKAVKRFALYNHYTEVIEPWAYYPEMNTEGILLSYHYKYVWVTKRDNIIACRYLDI